MIPTYSYIIYREREREITLYDDTIGHFGHILIIIKIFVLHFRGMKHTMGGGVICSFHGKHTVLVFQVEGCSLVHTDAQ
jgi:hypothetical protein